MLSPSSSSPWTSGWAQLLPRRAPSNPSNISEANTNTNGPSTSWDTASIASSSFSSSCDSAILLDLADANSLDDPSHHHAQFFKGSPLVSDPISSDLDEAADVLPLVHHAHPSPAADASASAAASSSSWRNLAKSALSSARARLGSVSSLATSSDTSASSPTATLANAAAVAPPRPPPTASTSKPLTTPCDAPAPLEYRLPWLGIGLPSTSRRALRSTILSLSRSRSTFTEPLNPDFDYTADAYSPLVTLLLAEDPNLGTMRAKLVPRTLSDRDFWHNYLYRVTLAVTHAKLDAGVPGALLPLIKSCSGPMLVASSPAVGSLVHRPRLNSTVRSSSISGAAPSAVSAEGAQRGSMDARPVGQEQMAQASAAGSDTGRGLVGLACHAPVDPVFVPLPDEDGEMGAGAPSPTPHTMVLHDLLPSLAADDPDLYSFLSAASSHPSTPLLELDNDVDFWHDHNAAGAAAHEEEEATSKPDDMDRMLEFDTDAFYVLLQDMALSAPLPVVEVPDALPESRTTPTLEAAEQAKEGAVGEDGMMVISLE